MMISNAQRPLTYNGFSLVYLDLETFLKVNRAYKLNVKTEIELIARFINCSFWKRLLATIWYSKQLRRSELLDGQW